MKKIFFLFALVLFFNILSCDSKDDAVKTTNFLKATINGKEVVFDAFEVAKKDYSDYSDIEIIATKSDDPTKKVILELEYLVTGTETCFEFQYIDGEDYYIIYPRENTSLIVNITENIAKKVKGNFSGTVVQDGGSGTIVIPNGSFDISY